MVHHSYIDIETFREGIVNAVVSQFERIAFCIRRGCANAWLLMIDRWNDKVSLATKDKFLWALNLLKAYDTKKGNSSTNIREVCDKKTF